MTEHSMLPQDMSSCLNGLLTLLLMPLASAMAEPVSLLPDQPAAEADVLVCGATSGGIAASISVSSGDTLFCLSIPIELHNGVQEQTVAFRAGMIFAFGRAPLRT